MIAQYFPPDVNGSSTRAYNAARGLAMQGCNVTVIAAFSHYPNGYFSHDYKRRILIKEELDGIKVIRTWVPNLTHSPISKRIIIHISFMLSSIMGIVYTRKVDVIFAMNPSFFALFSANVYKGLLGKNIVRNVDDLWPEVFYELDIVKSRVVKKILDFISLLSYRIPMAIIPVSHGYLQTLITKYHIKKEKIFVIEHGVDISKFQSPNSTNRSSLAKSNTKKTIMYSGNLNIGYDFETVFQSAKLLSPEPVRFIIRGTGELSDKLRQMRKEYNLSNLEVRTELLSREELVSLLGSADIFLLPMSKLSKAIDQGLPTKVLEYQAFGKPIVCISDGEAGKYIQTTQSGLTSETRTPEELARMIMMLVKDDDLAKKLGSNGLNYIKNNLTLEMVGKRLMDVVALCK
jgi:glycosyltransferase involved in cell wall biosynthesis